MPKEVNSLQDSCGDDNSDAKWDDLPCGELVVS